MYIWPSAPTVAPSGLAGGGGDHNELIVTWTVSGLCMCFSTLQDTALQHIKVQFQFSPASNLGHAVEEKCPISTTFQCQVLFVCTNQI